MPRPKGSKNKKTISQSTPVAAPVAVENIAEKIAAVEAEIATIGEQLKAKKDELKAEESRLLDRKIKEKAKADKAAAKQKAK